MTTILTRPPNIDPAVWRPEVPLVVMERCDSPQMTMVWLALRWLMALMPRRQGFSVREVADRAKVNYRKVGRWFCRLEELGLIERIGETMVPGLDTPRPIFSIDLRKLDALSHGDVLDEVLIRYQTNAPPPPRVPDAQLSYLDCEREEPHAHATFADAHADVREREREEPHAHATFADAHADVRERERDVREREHEKKTEEDRRRPARPLAREDSAPYSNPFTLPTSTPPAAPPDAPAVFAHPFQLWIEAVRTPKAIDMRHLEFMEQEHDQHTGGYGQYWVARAILAATTDGKERDIGAIYHILNRWRDENTYGSNAPKYTRRMEQQNGEKRKRTDRRNSRNNGDRNVDPNRLTEDDLPDWLK